MANQPAPPKHASTEQLASCMQMADKRGRSLAAGGSARAPQFSQAERAPQPHEHTNAARQVSGVPLSWHGLTRENLGVGSPGPKYHPEATPATSLARRRPEAYSLQGAGVRHIDRIVRAGAATPGPGGTKARFTRRGSRLWGDGVRTSSAFAVCACTCSLCIHACARAQSSALLQCASSPAFTQQDHVQRCAVMGTAMRLCTVPLQSAPPPYISAAYCAIDNAARHSPGPVYNTRPPVTPKTLGAPALHGQGALDRFYDVLEPGRLK